MTYTDRRPILLIVVASLVAVGVSCGPFGKPDADARTVVAPPPPPKPAPPVAPVVLPSVDPERVEPMLEAVIAAPLNTPETDAILAEADAHFQAGERFFQQGDLNNARARFDRAIEALLESPEDTLDRVRVEEKCAELVEAIYQYDAAGQDTPPAGPGYEDSPLEDLLSMTFPVDPNIEMSVKEELRLPVSDLPLEVNAEVMKYIRYFSSTRGQKTLVHSLQRLGRYRAMIRRVFNEEGVPEDLMYVGVAESGFQARALSRKRATGMWQFMSARGTQYGLARSAYFDERLDPEKSTRAAAQHLRDLYKQLGDWYLAMAAYNAGPGRVDEAVRRTGYADFWEFYKRRVLPRETLNYVPLILATVIMAKNPGEYDLRDVLPDPPLDYNTIEVAADTHLWLIADVLGKSLDELREYNPALLKDIAPAGYPVHVPKGTGRFVMAALETVPASRRATWRVHRVGYGETLTAIASQYKTTADQITEANGGNVSSSPTVGDLVLIPVSYTPTKTKSSAPARKRQPARKPSPRKSASSGSTNRVIQAGG